MLMYGNGVTRFSTVTSFISYGYVDGYPVNLKDLVAVAGPASYRACVDHWLSVHPASSLPPASVEGQFTVSSCDSSYSFLCHQTHSWHLILVFSC